MKFDSRSVIAALALCVTIPTFSQSKAPLIGEQVREMATESVRMGYPSLIIALVHGGQEEIATFGSVSDANKHEPTADTVYEIGSVTKTFTGLLLADAVVHGEVTLDDPLQRHLPQYSIPKKGERAITLLDLATQTSALPRLPTNLQIKHPMNPYIDYTVDDMKAFLSSYTLPFTPGEHYEYSNLGFGLLGQALAARAKMSYGELLQKRITAPLNMKDTSIALTPRMAERFAEAHDAAGGKASPWDFREFEGCGAIRSTARDLLLYLHAMMQPASSPLSKAVELAVRPERPTDRGNAKIGLAWQIEERNGRKLIWHNGMTGGYASFVGFTADGQDGVVVLTNISRSVDEIGVSALFPSAIPKEVNLTAAAATEYVGRYRLAPNFELTVTASGSQLSAQATGQQAFQIYPSAKDEFFVKVIDAQLSFHRDAKGKVDSLVLHQNGHDMPAPRVDGKTPAAPKRSEVKLDAKTLSDYVGRYRLAPTFELEVTAEGEQLFVQATAQQRLPVFASAKDEFFYKVVDAQLSFERDASGKVVAIVLHQNGQNPRGPKQ